MSAPKPDNRHAMSSRFFRGNAATAKPGQTVEGDEVFRLVPRHQLQGLRGRNDGAVEGKEQCGEERELRQQQQIILGHG